MSRALLFRGVVCFLNKTYVFTHGSQRRVVHHPLAVRDVHHLCCPIGYALTTRVSTIRIICLYQTVGQRACGVIILFGRFYPIIVGRGTINLCTIIRCRPFFYVFLFSFHGTFVGVGPHGHELSTLGRRHATTTYMFHNAFGCLLNIQRQRRATGDDFTTVYLVLVGAMFTVRVTHQEDQLWGGACV